MKTERILGALYGQALGDAMGMPSELWPRSRVKAHFGWIDRFLPGPKENNAACYFNRAEFTDDTSMALCLADALLEREGKIDPDLIGRNILDWALRFDAFNKNVLGPTSKIALNAIRDGKPVAELRPTPLLRPRSAAVWPRPVLVPEWPLLLSSGSPAVHSTARSEPLPWLCKILSASSATRSATASRRRVSAAT